MKHKLIPFSRLTIIFILAVTIPGGILSYLSIQNITNLKELTEKRILEEQNALADSIYLRFQLYLDEVVQHYDYYISSLPPHGVHKIHFVDSTQFISNPFILSPGGEFLWPFLYTEPGTKKAKASSAFMKKFELAEKNEFVYRNYPEAKASYLEALSYASGSQDSARTMNAIARQCIRTKDVDNALNYYTEIISRFYSVVDKDGFAYISYAIPQLLKLTTPATSHRVLHEVMSFLARLSSGRIPLQFSTTMVLDEISNWLSQDTMVTSTERADLEHHIQINRRRINFVNTKGNFIQDYIRTGVGLHDIRLIGDYIAISEGSMSGYKSIIVKNNTHMDTIYGFVLEVDSLVAYSCKLEVPSSFRFNYIIDVIKSDNAQSLNSTSLMSVHPLNPICQGISVLIKLKNENIVEERVTRSSWIYGIAIVLLLGGMLLGVILIIRDFQRERHMSRLRSEFVSNVTHELKTPLTSIYMFAESILLGRVRNSSEQKEYLGIILKETERLKRLINNILDFSRGEKNKQEYHFSDTNLSSLVQSSINDLDYWIVEKEFVLNKEIEADIHAKVDADAMKQAIINLLTNAIKYSHNNKEITVRMYLDQGLIYLEIEDKGIGIPEDELEHIFEKFYRIENIETQENSGTGLGLTLVKEIVEAHHGQVNVKSKPGQGSIFTIIINSI